jgi:hypothetical protein
MRRIAVLVVALLAAAAPLSAQSQQSSGSPVTDMMVRGRNALNDLNYAQADSISRRILALGTLLSRQQQIDALQLLVASLFPDEDGQQKQDTTIQVIKTLVALGASQGMPREMSHPKLDSLYIFVARAAQPAKLVLGSRIPGAVLYIDNNPQGVLNGLRNVLVPAGKQVQLSIRADGCVPWDTAITTQSADSLRIGYRSPRCSK